MRAGRVCREIDPELRFVQFVDGDCELVCWLVGARLPSAREPPRGRVVCGRRRERFPERSIYNRVADIEWNTPIGESKYCGGDAMIRVEALRQVDGLQPDDDRWRRTRPMRAAPAARVDHSADRRGDEPARHRDDSIPPMVETARAEWFRLCTRGSDARTRPRTALGPRAAQHDLVGARAAAFHSGHGLADTTGRAWCWPWPTRFRRSGSLDDTASWGCPRAMRGSGGGTAFSVAFRTPWACCATGPAGLSGRRQTLIEYKDK